MLAKREKYLFNREEQYLWEHGFPYNTMACCIFSKETVIQETKQISPVREKKAEKRSEKKGGETRALRMFIDLSIMQYIKSMCYCMI